jgi:hypothetical protein
MAVLGFNYTKLLAEKKQPAKGKLSVNNNVSITDVEEEDLNFSDEKNALKVSFKYKSTYKPDVADLTIEGNIIYVNDQKATEDLLEAWDDNNSLPKDVMREVINFALSKCNVQAIIMARDINVPSPIRMPRVEADED